MEEGSPNQKVRGVFRLYSGVLSVVFVAGAADG